jgi:hypothetical protein
MSDPAFASPDEIRMAFRTHLAATGKSELAYEDLWSLLRGQGVIVRGATMKKQRDTVYRALSTDPGIARVRPGVFAPAK